MQEPRIVAITLEQEDDSCGSAGQDQQLKISLFDSGAGGFAAITTACWSGNKEDWIPLAERIFEMIDAYDREQQTDAISLD